MRRILFLSFYFEPDLCAGSFRNTPLVSALEQKLSDDDEIVVVTTMPNRYSSYKESAEALERRGKVTIHRIALPEHQSGMSDQAKAFYKYYTEAIKIADNYKFDLVYASSSRLFTAFLGSRISRRLELPLYLDIRDIFRETIADVLRSRLARPALNTFISGIEKYTFSRAKHINLVSKGFEDYFAKYKKAELSFYTNGIDDIFLNQAKQMMQPEASPYIITYAGNIGESQGLHLVVPGLAKLLGDAYKIRIIGDGGAIKKLRSAIEVENISNVELLAPINRQAVIDHYNNSHFLFVHLNDLPAFMRVLPSKVFEYGCFNKPVIAGVNGYSRSFLKEHVDNVISFDPGNFEQAAAAIKAYSYRTSDRADFRNNFSRKTIMDKMSNSILSQIEG